jgi:phosphatidylinositol alpha 1,6-mannosyltransferase
VYSHSIAPSIDGVCRRFTGLLHEMVRQGHEVLLFTIEDAPEDLPAGLNEVVPLLHMVVPAYPDKKIGRPAAVNLTRIYSGVARHRPDVIHITNDALSNTFALVGLLLGVPVVGSFHTDLQDLLSSHKAHPLQSILTWAKERFDYEVLDSCGTTSVSFQHKLAAQGIQCEYVIKTAVDKAVFHPGRRSAALRRELCFGDDSAFLCVYVGRLSREKRLDVIISALRDLPHAYLAIVGYISHPTHNVNEVSHTLWRR